jgi:16S rRNA (adenine1518-N6/adenine1519-N6)-dimethyltransferase
MTYTVRAKKHLGQHFLIDQNIAKNIVDALSNKDRETLEIGPGMGVLTQFLIKDFPNFHVSEIDYESVEYLKQKYSDLSIIEGDFLKLDFASLFKPEMAIIGNFPYNISSQIMFKVLENRTQVIEVVGMFQKEVAHRIASPSGSKDYGILSVLMQAFYNIEYLFSVSPDVFSPPPRVQSGVIRLVRKEDFSLPCSEKLFFQVVKTTFNQRRKTIRNSIKPLSVDSSKIDAFYLNNRPEQLNVNQFVEICQMLEV